MEIVSLRTLFRNLQKSHVHPVLLCTICTYTHVFVPHYPASLYSSVHSLIMTLKPKTYIGTLEMHDSYLMFYEVVLRSSMNDND